MARRENEQDSQGSAWRGALTAATLGWDLVLPIFGGVLLGYLLDRWLGTGHIFTIGLLVLGIVVGYYNVFRFVQRLDAADRERKVQGQREEGE